MRSPLPCILIAALLPVGCSRNPEPVSADTPSTATAAAPTIQDGTNRSYFNNNSFSLPRELAATEAAAERPAPGQKSGGDAPAGDEAAYQERIKELFTAAENGEISRVLKTLEKGLNINDKDAKGETVLMRVAEKGRHPSLVIVLLAKGASVKEQDRQGQTALMKAAAAGNIETLKILMSPSSAVEAAGDALKNLGVPLAGKVLFTDTVSLVDMKDEKGQSALMKAALNGHKEAVTQLRYATSVATDHEGNTALMLAAGSGHAEVVDDYIGTSFSPREFELVTAADKNGMTALMKTAANGHLEVIRLVLDKFRTFNQSRLRYAGQKDKAGKTAVQHAEEKGHKEAAAELTRLIRDYEKLEEKDAAGLTPLGKAAKEGDLQAVKEWLDKRADPETGDAQGQTPLMLAAAEGNAEVVRALLAARPDQDSGINLRDKQGRTALMRAALGGHTDIVLLLAPKATLTLKDREGETALMHAADQGHTGVVKALMGAHSRVEPASERDLLVTAIDKKGMTALMKAAAKGNNRVVEALLNSSWWGGLDSTERTRDYLAMKDKQGKMALAYAEASGDAATLKLLQGRSSK
jgi:uncharacterized protein